MNFLTRIRASVTHWLLQRSFGKRYYFARKICPSTSSLMALGEKRRQSSMPLPEVTHLVYHQHTVENACVVNSLKSIAANVARADEVIIYDNGKTLHLGMYERFVDCDWFSYVGSNCDLPEQRSYTYGLNAVVPTAKSPIVIIWRTDYVYPPTMRESYLEGIATKEVVVPHCVRLGNVTADGDFVAENWSRFETWDEQFMAGVSRLLSLEASDDPAMFAIRSAAWRRIGGMSHQLWGYGWQFAELASRFNRVFRGGVGYLSRHIPFHQHHGSSLQHARGDLEFDQQSEVDSGIARLRILLGSDSALESYLFRWRVNQHADQDEA